MMHKLLICNDLNNDQGTLPNTGPMFGHSCFSIFDKFINTFSLPVSCLSTYSSTNNILLYACIIPTQTVQE